MVHVSWRYKEMITYIEDIIGVTYSQEPTLFLICTMVLVWFIYQFIQLIYNILGLNK